MKFLVDKMPTQRRCPYSEWKPYPPIVEEPGYYRCKIDMEHCNNKDDGSSCKFLCPFHELNTN